ncbi:kinase-like domain-containing protein [Rhizophagus clarus]|uniref:Kinase-like domain-containing protein n=1 Tax=Rhizophagus clarus TaxID=94130 RepID=A0A8H3LJ74_9GLOM|nr:kinase-like domain-containing protein [Rhizophagus clarus]
MESNKVNFKNKESCDECKRPYIDYKWCQQCNSKRFQQDFSNWTSKNTSIDRFVQEAQTNAKNSYEVLEWIPYDKLANINYYDKGGFSEIHKAIWLDGPIDSWNFNEQQWNRWKFQTGYEVVLKMLSNSSNLNDKFLDEWIYHYDCQKQSFSKFIQFFGITQVPHNLNYAIVMSYAKKGCLRKCLPDIIKFKWQDKLQLLKKIVLGLKVIHESKLTHGDFHDDLMKKCWDPDPSNRPTIRELEYKISEWVGCVGEYYKMNRNEAYEFEVPDIDDKLRNDMLEFVNTSNDLIQEQANISIMAQPHSQVCYTSRKLTEILFKEDSEYLEYMIS